MFSVPKIKLWQKNPKKLNSLLKKTETLNTNRYEEYIWTGGFSHRLQSGEGRPGLEAVLRGKTRSRESPPIPAVWNVAVEMRVPVAGVVGVRCHPSFLLRFSPVCRAGYEEWATLVLLKEIY